MFNDNDIFKKDTINMSNDTPAKNAMNCLGTISRLLEKLNPIDIDRPIKLNEEQINELLLIKGDFEFHKKRIVVIAAASYFEEQIINTIHRIYERLNDAVVAESFFKLLFKRKYYNLFEFETKFENVKENIDFYPNVSIIKKFFRYLGNDFNNWLNEFHIDKKWNPVNPEDEKIIKSIECFLFLGSIRNKIVHGDYNSVNHIIHAKDSENFYTDFEVACKFIEWLPWAIQESEKWGKERREQGIRVE